ncbi:MAG: ABC transporter substrate-binding protein, partial [Thermodesulfobacteriota bacterium]
MKKIIALIIVVSLLFGCKGKDNGNSSSAPHKRDTLYINIGSEPPSLDWSLATDSTSFTILNNIMEGLTRFGEDYRPEPALAEKWEISEDGKTLTFHLRKGVKWSDGKPLKAQDFDYSWKRLLDPNTGADYAYFLYDIEGAEAYNIGKETDAAKVQV